MKLSRSFAYIESPWEGASNILWPVSLLQLQTLWLQVKLDSILCKIDHWMIALRFCGFIVIMHHLILNSIVKVLHLFASIWRIKDDSRESNSILGISMEIWRRWWWSCWFLENSIIVHGGGSGWSWLRWWSISHFFIQIFEVVVPH